MTRFNKHGIANIYKEPRLLPFNRNMIFLDQIALIGDDNRQALVNALHHARRARHTNQNITIIGDASMGKSSFIGRLTPEVIRQMEFNRNNNKF